MVDKKTTLGLALSGGAARGFAHIGILKAFERESVPISFIAGTSSGSIVGAMYASGMDIESILNVTQRLKWLKDLVSPAWPKDGFLSSKKLSDFIHDIIPAKRFSELKIPLSIVSVDILSRKQYVFNKGNLDIAIRASCSVPGIFKPVKHQGMLLVDGGVVNNLPAQIVKDMGADIVVGVDVNKRARLFDNIDNVFKVLLQSHYIMMEANTDVQRRHCDYIIEPDIGKGGFVSIEKAQEFIKSGEYAAAPVARKIKNNIF